ncbi:MAG: class I SAM-dependent methyltransferase, partial [Planctomycetales bacterium]
LEWTPNTEHWQSQWHTIHWGFSLAADSTYFREFNTFKTVALSPGAALARIGSSIFAGKRNSPMANAAPETHQSANQLPAKLQRFISHKPGLRVCPHCSDDNHAAPPLPFSRDGWNLKQCGSCEFIYLENPPSYDELVSDRAWMQEYAARKKERRKRNPLLRAVKSSFRACRKKLFPFDKEIQLVRQYAQDGRLLDVGCGWGKTLRKLGGDVVPFGIEIGAEAAGEAHAYADSRGGQVIQADALSGLRAFNKRFFDAVLMHAYLEHETQPRPVLGQVARVLRPGGHLIIKVPNYASWLRSLLGSRWSGFLLPDHVNYFTPESLRSMVGLYPLEIVRCNLLDRLPTSDNMWLIARKPA